MNSVLNCREFFHLEAAVESDVEPTLGNWWNQAGCLDLASFMLFTFPVFPQLQPTTPPLQASLSCYISDSCDLAKK